MSDYTTLTARLDRIFSRYIRMRDSNEWGNVKCPICETVDYPWQQMTCAHFAKRRYIITRWDEQNAIATCMVCNELDESNLDVHMKFFDVMARRFGLENIARIEQSKTGLAKFTRSDLLEKIEYYKDKINELNQRP